MPLLPELQRGVMRAILDGETHPASLWLQGGNTAAGGDTGPGGDIGPGSEFKPESRLHLYRNTAMANFTEALRSSFPAIERLVGEAYFLQCAREFQRLYPSRSGDLQLAGEHFPAYLAHLHATDEYRYLGDVARLEWLVQESLLAADHEALNLAKLAAVPTSHSSQLKFRLHPAARLFASAYPCLKIWEANADEDAGSNDMIDLDSGAEALLLFRDDLRIQFYRLAAGEYEFLQALWRGDRFDSAVAVATEADAPGAEPTPFDAAAALQRFVAKRVIVDFN